MVSVLPILSKHTTYLHSRSATSRHVIRASCAVFVKCPTFDAAEDLIIMEYLQGGVGFTS